MGLKRVHICPLCSFLSKVITSPLSLPSARLNDRHLWSRNTFLIGLGLGSDRKSWNQWGVVFCRPLRQTNPTLLNHLIYTTFTNTHRHIVLVDNIQKELLSCSCWELKAFYWWEKRVNFHFFSEWLFRTSWFWIYHIRKLQSAAGRGNLLQLCSGVL